jgi:hypothetical protein
MTIDDKAVLGTPLAAYFGKAMTGQRLRIEELKARVRELETEVNLYRAQRDNIKGLVAGIAAGGLRMEIGASTQRG